MLKSPNTINGLFSLPAFSRRDRIYSSLKSSIGLFVGMSINTTNYNIFFLFLHNFNKNVFLFFTFVEIIWQILALFIR